MALDPKAEAALALHRFGFGPRAGSIAAIAADPRGALIAELDRAGAGRVGGADLLASGDAARAAFAFQQARQAERRAERAAQQANAQGNATANAQANAPSNAPGTGGAAAEMKGAEQPQAQTPPQQR